MRIAWLAVPLLFLGACHRPNPGAPESGATATSATSNAATADPFAADDSGQQSSDAEPRQVMQAQVVLDRLGFTPGVIDGKAGLSTRNALSGFQEARGLPVTGELDGPTREALAQWSTIPATRLVTIPQDFATGPFYAVPNKPEDQARMPALGYASLDEKLAERFHTTEAVLRELNPGGKPSDSGGAAPALVEEGTAAAEPASSAPANGAFPAHGPQPLFHAGQQIRVPNVGNDAVDPRAVNGDADWQRTLVSLGIGTNQPKVDEIRVSKSRGVLKAYDTNGKLVAVYTATMGSEHDPLPLGQWKVTGISRNPKFHYNPALFWDASPGEKKATLPPGPNGPVGVVWIDLSKPHYGIHGTPRPETIGRAESHGCVRLTNWDAARLAQMVHAGTRVLFEA